ncbi:MAG: ABC-type transport auxiliary lipoprotein family protein [Silvibacterium sp.]
MHRTIRLTLTSLLAVGLSGCGTGKPIHYYTVQQPAPPALVPGTHPVSLLVGNISAPGIYLDTPIAYRTGPNEIGTYQYSRWVEPPNALLKDKLIRMLRASGDYQSVAELGSTSDGQFVLRGRLYNFEEVDSTNIEGLVSMEFELYNRKTGKVVWSHYYSQSEPVQGKEISAVVAALDTNLDRGLKEVAAGLNQYFISNPVGKS